MKYFNNEKEINDFIQNYMKQNTELTIDSIIQLKNDKYEVKIKNSNLKIEFQFGYMWKETQLGIPYNIAKSNSYTHVDIRSNDFFELNGNKTKFDNIDFNE